VTRSFRKLLTSDRGFPSASALQPQQKPCRLSRLLHSVWHHRLVLSLSAVRRIYFVVLSVNGESLSPPDAACRGWVGSTCDPRRSCLPDGAISRPSGCSRPAPVHGRGWHVGRRHTPPGSLPVACTPLNCWHQCVGEAPHSCIPQRVPAAWPSLWFDSSSLI
jgi:hypothetical protein